MAILNCRVTPNARKTEILGCEPDENGLTILKLKLKAPPVDGKANQELVAFLSDWLELPKSRFEIARGEKSRVKRIEIREMNQAELEERLRSVS